MASTPTSGRMRRRASGLLSSSQARPSISRGHAVIVPQSWPAACAHGPMWTMTSLVAAQSPSIGAAARAALAIRTTAVAAACAATPRQLMTRRGLARSAVFARTFMRAGAAFQHVGCSFGFGGAIFLELRRDHVLAAGLALGLV